ncbi:hypothetical protein ACFVZR_19765 [Streptomyces sp. NPDC058316]
MSEYHFSVDGDSPGRDLRQLAQRLRQDTAIRTGATLALRPAPPAEGEMGTTLDVIALIPPAIDAGRHHRAQWCTGDSGLR